MMLLAILAAFIVFGVFRSLSESLSGGSGHDAADLRRMLVLPRRSMSEQLPLAHFNQLAAQPGVGRASHGTWFSAFYGPAYESLTTYAVDVENYFAVYPEYRLDRASLERFRADRIGIIVGKVYAERYGWHVGDRITLGSGLWSRQDRARFWEFQVDGILTHATNDADTNFALIRYDAFNEARAYDRNSIGWIVFLPTAGADTGALAASVSDLFATSSPPIRCLLESAYLQVFAQQLGDVGAVVAVVLSAAFAMVLMVVGNTFAVAARERAREIAVMRALGFGSGRIYGMFLGESLLVLLPPALLGLWIAGWIVSSTGQLIPFFPALSLSSRTVVIGIAVALVLAVLVTLLPTWRSVRAPLAHVLARG